MPNLPHVFSINYYFQVKIDLQGSCYDGRVSLCKLPPGFSLPAPSSAGGLAKAQTPALVPRYKLNSRLCVGLTSFTSVVIILCAGAQLHCI